MLALLERHQASLRRLCQQYRVARLSVFGSAARAGEFDPQTSDLDFLVEFMPMGLIETKDAYFGLWFALEELFGRPVDLVQPGKLKNPYLRKTVEQHQQTLYAAA